MISKAVKRLQPHPEERRIFVGRLEGWPLARPCLSPSFETAAQEGGLLRMKSELFGMISALLLLLCLGIGAAHAHAFLDHSDPRVGNTVKSPRIVSLWFTQNLEGSFSTIEVLDANGARMNVGNALVDAKDRKLLRVPVRALPAGTYTVKWHVLSVDTHTTDGNFTFRVGP
jgi:methionine-rich copper-binding protein CopC